MAAAFYNQTKFTIFIHLLNYFLPLLQPNTISFLLFDVNVASEPNVTLAMFQSKIKFHKI